MIELGPNRYGKSAIRLVKVVRGPDRHHLRDLTVGIHLEGEFAAAHVDGDNRLVVATDTMKNTVYALAADHLDGPIESFGLTLAEHFLDNAQVERATVRLAEHGWSRLPTPTGPAPDAFQRGGDLTRTAEVVAERSGAQIGTGIEDLVVLKTTKSAFEGFPRDRFTTLAEASDRILATRITAGWHYGQAEIDFDASFEAVRETLLAVFAEHMSRSVQESIWLMGRAILEARPEVDEIRMVLPNLHHWRVDLAPFGLSNENEIFIATTEPYGLIEATVRRTP